MTSMVGAVLLNFLLALVAGGTLGQPEATPALSVSEISDNGPLALHEDDECDATEADSHCGLSALQRRTEAFKQDPAVHEVETWHSLKTTVEGNPEGGKIHIRNNKHMVFDGTINIPEGSSWDISSDGAVLDGKNEFGTVRMFYIRGSLQLSGFYLVNGKTDYAGAMYFDFGSYGNITNCTFAHNEAVFMGGAILAKGSHLDFTQVNFKSNKAKNTCKDKSFCPKHRRHKIGQAVYLLSHTQLIATMGQQPKSQDFYFDKDFDGRAGFHCMAPKLGAHDKKVAVHHVKVDENCTALDPDVVPAKLRKLPVNQGMYASL